MVEIMIAEEGRDAPAIRELFWEYLQWGNVKLEEEFGIQFPIADMLADDMQKLGKFMPPAGRTILGYADGKPLGIICLKSLGENMGEVKRMYVRPEARGLGLGRALLSRLIEEARAIGYERLRLDSARFMREAHGLYRSSGFQEIPAYEGSEIPKEFHEHWLFMELPLG